jgi:cysteine-rich repeat protein
MRHDSWPLLASIVLSGALLWAANAAQPTFAVDPSDTATTTLTISICGDALVDSNEECDVPGQTGGYSTNIAGRQCTELCLFDSYCGDSVLQTIHGETCDDGNNTSGDFCSDICIIEPAAGGGGNTSGSSGGGGGGKSSEDYGDTSVSITGRAYPNATVNILEDGDTIGSVRANAQGDFQFSNDARPGATTYGFWANDSSGIRSTTFNTTFDVTQGAVTTVAGIYLAPTLRLGATTIETGGTLVVSGQTVPNARVLIHVDNNKIIETATADSAGRWTFSLAASRAGQGSHTIKVKFELTEGVSGTVKRESTFSALQSFGVGTGPKPVAGSADLSRDGKVNLIDFSILIFWWGTNGGNSNPPADINQNAKVGLEDFSILLFNWTG